MLVISIRLISSELCIVCIVHNREETLTYSAPFDFFEKIQLAKVLDLILALFFQSTKLMYHKENLSSLQISFFFYQKIPWPSLEKESKLK